jgi:acid phosphatase
MPRSRLAVLALLLGACASTAPAPAPKPTRTLSDDVHWVRNAVEYQAHSLQTYRAATRRVEELASGRPPGTWAVSVDADETAISNSLYEKERQLRKVEHSPERWAKWVRRLEAPPLPGAVEFLSRVRELGGKIAVVTNRGQPLCAETEADFRKYSIPYDVILCLKPGESSQKEPRFDAVRAGTAAPGMAPAEILVWVGDNIGDFPDLAQDARYKPEQLKLFGDRYFMIANPMYGSWEENPED